MAKFEDSMSILMDLEFSSPYNALEWLKTEDGYTYMGIYSVAHPSLDLWDNVRSAIDVCNGDIKKASKLLYEDNEITEAVYDFYYSTFWKPYRLNEIEEQHKADEIFIFGVNVGMKNAIKKTQELVSVVADGIIGNKTIQAINKYDFNDFNVDFDYMEIKYYDDIVKANPKKSIYAKGWRNRAEAV